MNSRTTEGRFRWRRFLVVFPLLLVVAFALPAIGITAYFAVLDNRIAKLEQRIRDMGQPVTLEELAATYPKVPDEENAALVYLEALALIERLDPEFERATDVIRLLDYTEPDGTLSEVVLSEVESYVNDLEPVYALFDSAVTKPRSQFEIDFSDYWGVSALGRSWPRQTARMESLRLHFALASGDLNQAMVCQRSMLRMAESLRMEPVVITQLVRVAICGIAMHSLEDCVNRVMLPEPEMRELLTLYVDADDPEAMIRAIVGERCAMNALLQEEKLSVGSNSLGDWLRNKYQSKDNRIRLLERFEPLVGLSEASWPKRIEFWRENRTTAAGDLDPFDVAGMVIPPNTRAISAFARGAAQLRMAQTALTIERYRSENGGLPEDLDALVPQYLPEVPEDPFDGLPLRYTKLEPGYRLYTVYEDRVDDGGVKAEKDESGDWHGDWVFEVRR
jgi:hypothetical protein